MTVERRKYTEEFKREAVQLMETSGKAIAELAHDLGINDNNLYRWRRLYGSQAQANTHGNGAEMAAELKRLQREVAVLRQERDILKHILRLVTYNHVVIEAQRKDRVSISWRPRILKWERQHPYALSDGSCC